MATSHEALAVPKVIFLGRMGDFGLGNPDGIPSRLAEATDEELSIYGEKLTRTLTKVTDVEHYSCIDGRRTLQNADGSQPETRHRQVGGTGLNYGVARNADSAVLDVIDADPENKTLDDKVDALDNLYEGLTGVKRSAHLGGCGGVGGEVDDEEAIATKPGIFTATEAIMQLPDVLSFTQLPYNPLLAERVKSNAAQTAQEEKAGNWQGDAYVARVQKQEPSGVEDLKTDDSKYHGHVEDAVVLIVSETRSLGEAEMAAEDVNVFPVGIKASRDMAKALAGQRGLEGAQQAMIANIAKHVAVADRLPSDKTPLFLVVDAA